MKKHLALCGAFAAALALAACQDRDDGADKGAVENASAESGVGSNQASNAVQDAASAVVGPTSAVTLGRTTDGFVTNAAIGDMYEIQAGNLANEKSKNAQVKALASMIVKDHTTMSTELKAAVASSGANVQVPAALDERRAGMIDNLKQAAPDQFDKTYIAQQVAAHREAVELAQTYADAGDNAALKAHATKGLPKIQAHLEQAQKLEGGM